MLDKSIPYQNIIMCADRDHLICMEEPVLPEGFSFRCSAPGMKSSGRAWNGR